MKKSMIFSALALSSCAYYTVPAQTVPVEREAYTAPKDTAERILLGCDALGFQRGTPAERLCAMRGIDRYAVDYPTSVPGVPMGTRSMTYKKSGPFCYLNGATIPCSDMPYTTPTYPPTTVYPIPEVPVEPGHYNPN